MLPGPPAISGELRGRADNFIELDGLREHIQRNGMVTLDDLGCAR